MRTETQFARRGNWSHVRGACLAFAAGLAVTVAGLGLAGCGGGEDEASSEPGTSLVLISIDTLRSDRLAIYGGDPAAPTPAIDALARDGVVFERAYANVPLTLPSHASLFTGLLPPQHGVRDNLGQRLDGGRHPTLAALLAARGYRTGGFVSAFVLRGATGIGAGFSTWDDAIERRQGQGLGAVERPASRTVELARQWLDGRDEASAGGAARPFFLFVHLFEPHAPYAAPEPWRSRAADPYRAEIAAADAAVATLIADLRARGLYDEALVVLLSDHGEGLGDHGEDEHGILLYRESLQVPLVIKLPRQREAGRRVASPVSLVDVLPTLAPLLRLAPPPELAGDDVLGELAPERALYAETWYPRLHLGWSELRSAISGRFHLIEGPEWELYDVVGDPAERHDVAPANRRVAAALRRTLAEAPSAPVEQGPVDPEEARRLSALGYLVGGPSGEVSGRLPDPRREIGVLARVRAAVALARTGRLEESIAVSEEVLSRQPNLSDARLQLAWNLAALGRTDEAVEQYREAARRDPAQVHAVALELARIELDRGAFAAAAEQAELARSAFPDDARVLLGEIALERGDWDAAEAAARELLAETPPPGPLAALFLLARAQAGRGDLAAAVATLSRASAEVEAGRAEPLAGLDATLGDLLARSGRAADGEAAFRRELARFPHGSAAYVRLAYLLAAQRRFDDIAPTLDAMVAARPGQVTANLAAETMAELGNAGAAAEYRRRARELGEPQGTP